MNPYSVSVWRHSRKLGWVVEIQFTMDTEETPPLHLKGERLVRRYHYKKDADECALMATVHLNHCPQFYKYEDILP